MTLSDAIRIFDAKEVRKKWVAHCPSHRDSHPSLALKAGEKCVLIKCWAGCDTRDILAKVGLTLRDTFYDAGSKTVNRFIWRNELERMRKRCCLAIVMGVIEPSKRKYWQATVKNLQKDIFKLRYEHDAKFAKEYDLQKEIKETGWDALWEKVSE